MNGDMGTRQSFKAPQKIVRKNFCKTRIEIRNSFEVKSNSNNLPTSQFPSGTAFNKSYGCKYGRVMNANTVTYSIICIPKFFSHL